MFEVAALDPADEYANLQLTQLALKSRTAGGGDEALQYLDRLPAKRMEAPNIAILRLLALASTWRVIAQEADQYDKDKKIPLKYRADVVKAGEESLSPSA